MRKRTSEILQKLLKYPNEKQSMESLMEQYRISEKSVKNDVQEIMDYIASCGYADTLSFDGRSLCVQKKENLTALYEEFYNMDIYEYKMSLEERKSYIILSLLYNQKEFYSMQQLADELFVTRNTIINDCRIVEEYLNGFEVSFVAKSKKGIRIDGATEKKEVLVIEMFHSLIPNCHREKDYFVSFLFRKFHFQYRIADILEYMTEFAKNENIILAKEIFYELSLSIFLLVNRIMQGEYPTQRVQLDDELELDIIGRMVRHVVDKLGLQGFEKEKIISIERIIVLRGGIPQVQSIDDFELCDAICRFLYELTRWMDVNLRSDDLLIESLVSHIKSMDNWNEQDYKNWDEMISLDESFEEFQKVRQLADDKFHIIEEHLSHELNEKMKVSIVIHVCAALLRNRKNMETINVIVSCPGSMATGKYVEAQVKSYFNFNMVKTMTISQIKRHIDEIDGVDFIISTVPVLNINVPVIVVSPLMTIEDISKIQSIAFQRKKQTVEMVNMNQSLIARIYEIYQYGTEEEVVYLNEQLRKVIKDLPKRKIENTKSVLLKLLQTKYVKVIQESLQWKEAMQIASTDMIRDGFFGEAYVKEAIGNVEEYGNYIIVNQGIALAHARKETGVYEDGISLLVAKNGIEFEDHEMVYLLFFFSQKGDTDYLNLFKEIIKLGEDQQVVRKMTEFDNGEEVIQYIGEILN